MYVGYREVNMPVVIQRAKQFLPFLRGKPVGDFVHAGEKLLPVQLFEPRQLVLQEAKYPVRRNLAFPQQVNIKAGNGRVVLFHPVHLGVVK